MKLLVESFLRIVESPSELIRSSQPPANEHYKPVYPLARVNALDRLEDIFA